MDRYFQVFKKHSDYEEYINNGGGVDNTNICVCEDVLGGDVHYNKVPEDIYIVAQFDDVPKSKATRLMDTNATSMFTKIEIDGVVQESVVTGYTFSESSTNHKVKYTLSNPTTLGNKAFSGCTELVDIVLPKSISSIGSQIFSECTNLRGITLNSENAPTMSGLGFAANSGKKIYVPYESINAYKTSSGWSAYSGVTFRNIKIEVEYTVTDGSVPTQLCYWWKEYDEYDGWYYHNASNLFNKIEIDGYDVNIADIDADEGKYMFTSGVHTVKYINDYNYGTTIADSFTNCTCVTNVKINKYITKIDMNAFNGTTYYNDTPDGVIYLETILYKYKGTMPQGTNIVIKDGTAIINEYAFYRCSGLTSISIPNSVTSIGGGAFEGCSGLTSITIPDSVTTISGYAFNGCISLTNVTIPNSVTNIDNGIFSGCTNLVSVTIGTGVTNIAYGTFWGCTSLTGMTIPSNITLIENSAFRDCTSLTGITIPNSVTNIGNGAFESCSSLTNITIPNSVTSIGYAAFQYCLGLTSVVIPNSVASIGDYAFQYCSGLTSVTVERNIPPTLSRAVFNNNASGRKIYVPSASVDTYKAATNWKSYASAIEAIPT